MAVMQVGILKEVLMLDTGSSGVTSECELEQEVQVGVNYRIGSSLSF